MITRKARRWMYYITVSLIFAALVFLALPSLQRAIERAQQEIKPKNSVVEAAPESPAEDLQPQEQSAFEKVAKPTASSFCSGPRIPLSW